MGCGSEPGSGGGPDIANSVNGFGYLMVPFARLSGRLAAIFRPSATPAHGISSADCSWMRVGQKEWVVIRGFEVIPLRQNVFCKPLQLFVFENRMQQHVAHAGIFQGA